MRTLHHYQHPLTDGIFVIIKESTLTHHNHPESTVYIRVTLGVVVHIMGLDKYVMAHIHHYSITQSIFMALRSFELLDFHTLPAGDLGRDIFPGLMPSSVFAEVELSPIPDPDFNQGCFSVSKHCLWFYPHLGQLFWLCPRGAALSVPILRACWHVDMLGCPQPHLLGLLSCPSAVS